MLNHIHSVKGKCYGSVTFQNNKGAQKYLYSVDYLAFWSHTKTFCD